MNELLRKKKMRKCIFRRKKAEIKNKMSEDMRILFTEYRQKRKGDFDSTTRRANDLKEQDEED